MADPETYGMPSDCFLKLEGLGCSILRCRMSYLWVFVASDRMSGRLKRKLYHLHTLRTLLDIYPARHTETTDYSLLGRAGISCFRCLGSCDSRLSGKTNLSFHLGLPPGYHLPPRPRNLGAFFACPKCSKYCFANISNPHKHWQHEEVHVQSVVREPHPYRP